PAAKVSSKCRSALTCQSSSSVRRSSVLMIGLHFPSEPDQGARPELARRLGRAAHPYPDCLEGEPVMMVPGHHAAILFRQALQGEQQGCDLFLPPRAGRWRWRVGSEEPPRTAGGFRYAERDFRGDPSLERAPVTAP